MSLRTTWKPYIPHGKFAKSDLPSSVFAFPKERKEPLTDASHVRSAIARFHQVQGVSDRERDVAFANLKKAAKYYGVDMTETNWHERRPSYFGDVMSLGMTKRSKSSDST